MSKKCAISGKGVQTGNNVSKSNRKTRRRFMPNLQEVAVYSEILGAQVTLRLSSNGLRTIEKNGGIDMYLLTKPVSRLTEEAKELRKRIEKAKVSKGL
ncbi:MAG: 50S ribosomal protein L28 [Alphaproteobacteria bacterium]|nr:50S ribosomal protein L28 [Alphaproteobacteria bacterium]